MTRMRRNTVKAPEPESAKAPSVSAVDRGPSSAYDGPAVPIPSTVGALRDVMDHLGLSLASRSHNAFGSCSLWAFLAIMRRGRHGSILIVGRVPAGVPPLPGQEIHHVYKRRNIWQASSHISRGTVDHLPRIYLPPHGQQNMGCLCQALQKNLGKEAKTGATRKIDDWSSVRLYAVAGRFVARDVRPGSRRFSRLSPRPPSPSLTRVSFSARGEV